MVDGVHMVVLLSLGRTPQWSKGQEHTLRVGLQRASWQVNFAKG